MTQMATKDSLWYIERKLQGKWVTSWHSPDNYPEGEALRLMRLLTSDPKAPKYRIRKVKNGQANRHG